MCLARFRKRLLASFFALVLGMLLAVVSAGSALADAPAESFDNHLSDPSGYLDDSQETARALNDASGETTSYAALTDNFAPLSAQEWCVESRNQGAGNSQSVLLAIAVKERAYYICPSDDVSFSASRQERIVQGIEPLLSQGQWEQAVKVLRPARPLPPLILATPKAREIPRAQAAGFGS